MVWLSVWISLKLWVTDKAKVWVINMVGVAASNWILMRVHV